MTTRHDAVTLLERADPIDLERLVDENDIAVALARARRMIVDARPAAPERAPTPAKPRRRRSRVVALTAAGVVILSLVVAAWPGHGHRSGLGVLNAAAAVAARQASTVAPAGKYFHVVERDVGYAPVGQRSNVQVSYEWWVAADGAGRLVRRAAPWGPDSAPPGCGCHQVGNTLVTDRTFGPGQFGEIYRRYVDLADAHPIDPNSLPTTTAALRERLRAGEGSLPQVAWLLANPMDSPELRSALFRVAAHLPGVRTQSHATDPAGRRGVAMSGDAPSTVPQRTPKNGWPEFRVIFDPGTSRILAWEIILHDGSTTWVQSRSFIERGIVSTTHSVP